MKKYVYWFDTSKQGETKIALWNDNEQQTFSVDEKYRKKTFMYFKIHFWGHNQVIHPDASENVQYNDYTSLKCINYFTKKSSLTHSTVTPTFSNEIESYSKTTDNVLGSIQTLPDDTYSLSSSSDFGWTRTYDELRFKITDNNTNSVDDAISNIRVGESVSNLISKQWSDIDSTDFRFNQSKVLEFSLNNKLLMDKLPNASSGYREDVNLGWHDTSDKKRFIVNVKPQKNGRNFTDAEGDMIYLKFQI